MPVFLDFPIEFFRHLLELLLLVDRCDAVNRDPIRKGSLPLAMSLAEVDTLPVAQWTWVSLDVSVCITYISDKPSSNSKRENQIAPFSIADIRSFCKSA